MADVFSTFLHFRSLTTNYYSPLFLPPKQYFSSALHSHNSRFSRTRRRPPHLLLLLKPSPIAASASEIVVISTHEHSDGSVLFRFGDPSEIQQNVEVEESEIVKEEIEEEGTDGSSMVMVMEGEDESHATASGSTEAGDGADSVVSSSNTLIAVEGELLFSEKSLTAKVDIEVPVLILNNKMGVISSPDLETEQIENVEGGVSSSELEVKQIENVERDLTSNKETEGVSSLDLEMKMIENVEGDLTSNRETRGVSIPDLEMKLIENVDGLNEEGKDLTSNEKVGSVSSLDLEIKEIGNVEGELTSNEEIEGGYSPDLDIKLIENVDGPNDDKDVTYNEETGGVSGPDIEIKQIENVDGLNEEDENVTLDEEMGGVSSLALDIQQVDKVEGLCEEDEDLTSDKEIGSVSSPDLEIKQIENVEDLNDEDKDLSAVEASTPDGSSLMENATVEVSYDESLEETSNVTCTSNETESTSIPGVVVGQQTADVEERPNEDVDSEVVDDITTVASLEKESDDISPADVDADGTGELGESLNEECEDSPVNDSVLNISSEVENRIPAVVLLEKETDGNSSVSDIEIEPTGNVEEGSSEEYEDSPIDKKSEMLNNTAAALLENEAVEVTSPPHEDSLVNASEVEYEISEVVLVEKETDGNTSASNVEIEPTLNVEEGINEGYEDFPVENRSEVLNNTTAALPEKEAADITSAPFEDSFVDASVLNESSEVENGISAVVLVDEETEGNTSTSDVGMEPTENVEEAINEDFEEPPVDTGSEGLNDTMEALSEKETADITATDIDVNHTSNGEQGGVDEILEEPNSVETCITPQEVSEKETADAIASVALKMDPVVPISALGTDAAIIINVVPVNELQNAEIHNEKDGDDSESFDDNLVSSSSNSEPSMGLYKQIGVPNSQAGMNSLATEASSETDLDSIEAVEMQNALSNDNESDAYGGEDDSRTMELPMTRSIISEEPASGYESEIQNETVGYVSEKDATQLLTVSPQLEADSMLEEEIGTQIVEETKEDDESENQAVGVDLAEALVYTTTAPESAEDTISSQEILTTDFILSSGAALLSHPSKVLTGGEDAYFIANQTWLGIADGVSQWSFEGTSPGVYAKELMKKCEKLISDCSGNSINNPLELLDLGVAQTHSPGCSTVLIAQFDGQALHVANIGDSGFIVLRHGAVYKRSSPIRHAFSLPIQIKRGDDCSSLAQLYRVDLEEDDIIVTATDGLLDNLYDQEILLITMKSLTHGKTPEEIAEVLAKKAQEVGRSASGRSPFADEAQAAGFPGFSGGKLDDVAVIVSLVQRR